MYCLPQEIVHITDIDYQRAQSFGSQWAQIKEKHLENHWTPAQTASQARQAKLSELAAYYYLTRHSDIRPASMREPDFRIWAGWTPDDGDLGENCHVKSCHVKSSWKGAAPSWLIKHSIVYDMPPADTDLMVFVSFDGSSPHHEQSPRVELLATWAEVRPKLRDPVSQSQRHRCRALYLGDWAIAA